MAAAVGTVLGLNELGQSLRDAAYSSANILSALHEQAGATAANPLVYELRLGDPSPLAVYIKLFTLGVPVEADWATAGAGLSEDLVGAMLQHELVRREGPQLEPRVAITEAGGLFVLHDRRPDDGEVGHGAQHVLGPNPSAHTLAGITPRYPSNLTLDLGCGSGIQAFFASRHSERVIATDINDRAIELGRMGAALNGITNIEWREGSLFEPVHDLKFDLIVANPPFVISPDSSFMWRDGGRPAGGLNQELVSTIPLHLQPGAFACMLLNWPQRSGEPADAAIKDWLGDGTCDTWLLHADSWDPLSYAARWTEPETKRDGGVTLRRWLDFFDRETIEELHFGALLLRGREQQGWFRTDELPSKRVDPSGGQLVRAFENYDRLQVVTDDDLLEARVRVPDGYRLEQTARLRNGIWTTEGLMLCPSPGIHFAGTLDGPAAEFIFKCDGQLTVREALAATGQQSPLEGAVGAVRRMLALGSLEFVDVPGPGRPASNSGSKGDSE